MCGKVIKPEENGMLVRTYGKSTWTDKVIAGTERSKFGPMYVHFNQKCSETCDFYGPGNHFDYSRITIDTKTKEKLKNSESTLLKKPWCQVLV